MTTRASKIIKTPEDREWVIRFARQTADGTIVQFRKATRSNEQNEKMWAMLSEVSDQVVWYGEKLPPEDWKDIFTASLRHARVVPGIDKGTFVPLGMRTSQMTIEEMSNLIELMHAFGAENGVKFKEPGEAPPTSPSPEKAGGEPDPTPPATQTQAERDREQVVQFARLAISEARVNRPAEDRGKEIGMIRDAAIENIGPNAAKLISQMAEFAIAVVDGDRTADQYAEKYAAKIGKSKDWILG
ncbi:recombination protein NinB [Martelella lutilitoris]|uniref:Recombination protein NinB n=1 Tax=Martelella lutilitoris TaxID=2583532 RepID=A0A7T7HHR2_9HYPH|nr:recombination protein NinB [Martelella lutilitoris]QQM29338.1 recombination protein NinB [Martelella lutilitoris]